LTTLAQQYATTYPGDLMLERLVQEYRKTGDQAAEADALRRLTTAFPNAPDIQAARARLQSLQAPPRTDQNKIGVLFPLSGPGARAGRGMSHSLELGTERIIEKNLRLWGRGRMIQSGEQWHDDSHSLHGHGQVLTQEPCEGANLGRQTEGLQLAAAIKLEGGLKGPGHLERSSGHACDGHQRVRVELEDFLGLIRENRVAGRGPMVAGNDDSLRAMERKDRRRLQRLVG
jgi:hypothetical protein